MTEQNQMVNLEVCVHNQTGCVRTSATGRAETTMTVFSGLLMLFLVLVIALGLFCRLTGYRPSWLTA